MLKIRYDAHTGLLSGWTDRKAEFDTLVARDGEDTAELDIVKPVGVDDYEYLVYQDGKLLPSGKSEPTPIVRRDLAAEINEIKARLNILEVR